DRRRWLVVVAASPAQHLVAEALEQLLALVDWHLEHAEQQREDSFSDRPADEVEQLVRLLVGAVLQVLEESQRHNPTPPLHHRGTATAARSSFSLSLWLEWVQARFKGRGEHREGPRDSEKGGSLPRQIDEGRLSRLRFVTRHPTTFLMFTRSFIL